ncbi:Hypothetical_protein [Hexamita inflata]|uniref:Hypothetical_protein n=1 Tax=Hexamita inflata TaxID=28002 RepID=A0AA86QVC9_9EUKA|nr:Hypothetical protein HINF_LOCUS47694 [Hexamita inflata]
MITLTQVQDFRRGQTCVITFQIEAQQTPQEFQFLFQIIGTQQQQNPNQQQIQQQVSFQYLQQFIQQQKLQVSFVSQLYGSRKMRLEQKFTRLNFLVKIPSDPSIFEFYVGCESPAPRPQSHQQQQTAHSALNPPLSASFSKQQSQGARKVFKLPLPLPDLQSLSSARSASTGFTQTNFGFVSPRILISGIGTLRLQNGFLLSQTLSDLVLECEEPKFEPKFLKTKKEPANFKKLVSKNAGKEKFEQQFKVFKAKSETFQEGAGETIVLQLMNQNKILFENKFPVAQRIETQIGVPSCYQDNTIDLVISKGDQRFTQKMTVVEDQ